MAPTRQAESIDAARHILALALNNHPRKAIVHYNLACYECQLGDIGRIYPLNSEWWTLLKIKNQDDD